MIKIEPSTTFEENAVYYFDYYWGSGRMNTLVDIIQRVLGRDKSIIIYDFEDLPFEEELKDKISEVYQKRITLHKLKEIYGTSKKILELLPIDTADIGNSPVIIIPSINLFSSYYSSPSFSIPENIRFQTQYMLNKHKVLLLMRELTDKYTFILAHQLMEGIEPEVKVGGSTIPQILL